MEVRITCSYAMLMLIDVGGVGDSAPGDSCCAVVLLLYIPEFPIQNAGT